MSCPLPENTVHGYFDGELDAVRSFEFEHHLETCAACQAQLKEIGSLHNQLQSNDLFEEASPRLLGRIRKQIAKETNGSRAKLPSGQRTVLISTLAAAVAAVASFAIVFFVLQSHSHAGRVTAELIDAHVRSLQPGHLTDVLSTDQHTVKPWFDGKLDFVPPVSDFSQQGFPLVGGRLDIVDGHDVAVLVYARRKHFINFFVWPYREAEANFPESGSQQGYNWFRWRSGGMEFCLVSDTSAADLRQLKDLIHQ
jgi:anti-sigma factor RsiW